MESKKLSEIAADYGTPSYVFDKRELLSRVWLLRKMLPRDVRLCFAMKANPFLVEALADAVDIMEVCSPGEYEICIRAGIDPNKIVVSGVNKTTEAMERIFSYSEGAGTYTIESELHYRILKECAARLDRKLKVLLRLSSGNQFGMDRETLERVLTMIRNEGIMDVVGVHYYAGTQKKPKRVEKELEMLNAYGKELKERFEMTKLFLEYGPGLMVSYFQNDTSAEQAAADAEIQLRKLSAMLDGVCEYTGIAIELGRFLTADCGLFLTRIADIKQTEKNGFIIVDGGIHQLHYYGQMMGMKTPYIRLLQRHDETGGEKDAEEKKTWTICGSLCTVNDVLARDAKLSSFDIGDVLVFERCGAYSVTEAMALFLSRELPQVLLVNGDGEIHILRETKETNILNGKTEEKQHGKIT